MTKFRQRYACTVCGHKWKGRPHETPDGAETEDTPNCPLCEKVMLARGMDYTSNRAPAAVGMNIGVKAVDETAKIVMEDYGMTDLRSDVRESESAAPKLAPVLQAQADNFFGGGGARRRGGINLAAHARAAISGGLRSPQVEDITIGSAHRQRLRPNVEIVGRERGPV